MSMNSHVWIHMKGIYTLKATRVYSQVWRHQSEGLKWSQWFPALFFLGKRNTIHKVLKDGGHSLSSHITHHLVIMVHNHGLYDSSRNLNAVPARKKVCFRGHVLMFSFYSNMLYVRLAYILCCNHSSWVNASLKQFWCKRWELNPQSVFCVKIDCVVKL